MTSFLQPSALDRAVLACALAAALAGCGPKDGSAEYADGMAAFAARDLRRAEKRFAESLERSPGSVDAWVMLARVRMDLGDMAAAAEASGRASALAPGDSDVIELAGQTAYHSRDFDKAREAYAALAKSDDPAVRSRGWCGLAVIEMCCMADIPGRGATAELGAARARVALLTALRLDGRNPAARYHLGRLYRDWDSFGYTEAARDQFDLFTRLEKNDSERVKTVLQRVIPELNNAIASAAARRPGADRRNSAASAAALKKAEDAFARGSFKTAKLHYSEAYSADVLSFPAALGLAKCCEKMDSSPAGRAETFKYYKAAAQLRPGSYTTLLAAGDLAAKLGRHAEAVEAYSRAVTVRPYDITALDGLIRALRRCERTRAAAVYQEYRAGLSAR